MDFSDPAQPHEKKSDLKDTLRSKYFTFRQLLAENNRVLTLMTELEERLASGERLDLPYVRASTASLVDGVRSLVRDVNILSNNRYKALFDIHGGIAEALAEIVRRKPAAESCGLSRGLRELSRAMSGAVGHKNAHLGELSRELRLPAPPGFAISTEAFARFVEHNRLRETIAELFSAVDVNDSDDLAATSARLQRAVREAALPDSLVTAFRVASVALAAEAAPAAEPAGETAPALAVSVRSSAIHEDGDFTFAGQYATFLNVPLGELPLYYREVLASLFSPKALFYAKSKGFSAEDLVMAVGVLRMVRARAAGVVNTRNPDAPDDGTMIINGVWGLGRLVVDGSITPHGFVVSRDGGAVLASSIPTQPFMLVCGEAGGVREVPVPADLQGRPCLSGEELRVLSAYAVALESYYGAAQDIEWALDEEGRILILQSRTLHLAPPVANAGAALPPRYPEHPMAITGGAVASKGVACGPAYIVRDEEQDLKAFPHGAVLIAHHTSTRFVTVMHKAAAIVTDVGSVTGHMALLAREYSVPALLETGAATRVITQGEDLTVDAVNGIIYRGLVEGLCAWTMPVAVPGARGGNRAARMLEKALALISPLYLLDPDSDNFRQEGCRTLHDITRFIHEKAMAEIIFMSGRPQEVSSFEDLMQAVTFAEAGLDETLRPHVSDLQADIPMTTHVLDLDCGLRSSSKKVSVKDIASEPFHAFMKGLYSMTWPKPAPAAAPKGIFPLFPGSLTARDKEGKPESKSYAIIATSYMNFNLKLGYHFSMVEAYASETINDNYIKYFFKGGGASADRKLRRVRLIREILKKIHFRVSVTDDVVNALLTKYRREDIEKRLEIMGKLTVYTKQLDMAMFNDAVTDMFIEDFFRDHLPEGWF